MRLHSIPSLGLAIAACALCGLGAPRRAAAQKPEPPVIAPVAESAESAETTEGPGAETVAVIEQPAADAPPGAEAAPCDPNAPGCEPAPPPPTHFIVEIDLGANLTGDIGSASELVLGVGGQPFDLPLIFYFIGQASYITAGTSGSFLDTGGYQDSHSYLNSGLGVRAYLRVWGPFRVFAEVTFGTAMATARLDRDGFAPTETDGWYFASQVAGGFQIRVIHQLSLGARVGTLFTDDGLSTFREALGVGSSRPLLVQGSATWHF